MQRRRITSTSSRKRSGGGVSLHQWLWRWFVCLFAAGIATTILVSLYLFHQIDEHNSFAALSSSLSSLRALQKVQIIGTTTKDAPGGAAAVSSFRSLDRVEREILAFFRGEERALQSGAASYSRNGFFRRRVALRMRECRRAAANSSAGLVDNNATSSAAVAACQLRVVFVGSAQLSGRDNFYNSTYPFVMRKRLEKAILAATGLELVVQNHAMDSDLGREGPQTNHMCLANLIGNNAGGGIDVIGWDFGGMANKAAQVETFVRNALRLQQPRPPALILVNREGPHGLSRRGQPDILFDVSPGHHAIVYRDNETVLSGLHQRQEPYENSSEWQRTWQSAAAKVNRFWLPLFEKYQQYVDFAAIDPRGAIWHLDHLEEFSNQAFDAVKALPLVDCGHPGHPPPCDQIPQFVINHLTEINRTVDVLPRNDTTGAVCGVKFGCRHFWYGGSRSHALRGELNAAAILRGLKDALTSLPTEGLDGDERGAAAHPSTPLPEPLYCSAKFCNQLPSCITSYEPNLAAKLQDQLAVADNKNNKVQPRLGICHYANNPTFALNDIRTRYGALGYVDRKFAYQLAVGKNDVPIAEVSFNTAGGGGETTGGGSGGPLILCEPPCFVDECPTKRKMPLVDHLTSIRVDGHAVTPLSKKHRQPSVEVGRFCYVILNELTTTRATTHTLRLETNVTAPEFVMFSHIISF